MIKNIQYTLNNLLIVVYFGTLMLACKKSDINAPNPSTPSTPSVLQKLPSDSISQDRAYLTSAVLGNKLIMAGGYRSGALTDFSDRVDIFDWSSGNVIKITESLIQGRAELTSAVIGNKLIMAGGISSSNDTGYSNVVDIFDWSSGSLIKRSDSLSQKRSLLTSATIGNRVIIAGGYNRATGYSDVVDIFDWSSGTLVKTVEHLYAPRNRLTSAVIGNKVIFAGGNNSGGPSDVVDIFDWSSGTLVKTVEHLKEARYNLTSAVVGSKLIIAGGFINTDSDPMITSNMVDIFDWSSGSLIKYTDSLSEKRGALTSSVLNNKLIIAGGVNNNGYSNVIDIFDWSSGTLIKTVDHLSEAKGWLVSSAIDNKFIIAGGMTSSGFSKKVEIFKPTK